MTDALVPGCPVGHPRKVYVLWAVVVGAVLAVAIVWPSVWTTVALGVIAFVAAFHPVCRIANRHGSYGHNQEEKP